MKIILTWNHSSMENKSSYLAGRGGFCALPRCGNEDRVMWCGRIIGRAIFLTAFHLVHLIGKKKALMRMTQLKYGVSIGRVSLQGIVPTSVMSDMHDMQCDWDCGADSVREFSVARDIVANQIYKLIYIPHVHPLRLCRLEQRLNVTYPDSSNCVHNNTESPSDRIFLVGGRYQVKGKQGQFPGMSRIQVLSHPGLVWWPCTACRPSYS